MTFVCLAGTAISAVFLAIAGIFELINYLTDGKFETWVVNLFSEP